MEEWDDFERTVSVFDEKPVNGNTKKMESRQAVSTASEEEADDFERTVSVFDSPISGPGRSTAGMQTGQQTNGQTRAGGTVPRRKEKSTTETVLLIVVIAIAGTVGILSFSLYLAGPLIILAILVQLGCLAGIIASIIGLTKK